MDGIMPCLWFDGQAEEAAHLYTGLFAGSKVHAVTRYPADNPGDMPVGSVLTVAFDIGGQRFTALNGGPGFPLNPSISFFIFTKDQAETDRVHAALVEGGKELMPLDAYPWSPRYGWVEDRFGVSWQVMMDDAPRRVMPCLMFANEQHGRAQEAMEHYAQALDGHVDLVDRYAAGEGPEDTVKHGRVLVGDQWLACMDSHEAHAFGFNEGVSLQVVCQDQAEVDRFWASLSKGGEAGPCGWVKDKFGVSWQVVPRRVMEMLEGGGEPAARAFQAMLGMKKLDIRALEMAYQAQAAQ